MMAAVLRRTDHAPMMMSLERGGERQGKSGSRIPRNGDRAGGDGGGTGEDVI